MNIYKSHHSSSLLKQYVLNSLVQSNLRLHRQYLIVFDNFKDLFMIKMKLKLTLVRPTEVNKK